MNIAAFLRANKREATITAIFFALCVVAMFDCFNAGAIAFVAESFDFALSNIAIAAVLKIIAGALPLTEGISSILDKIFNFFFLANILIGIEYVLLIANKILFVKILIIACFALRFFAPFRAFATKVLIVLLFFNPGLNLYINAVKIIATEANMTINAELSARLNSLKNTLGIKPKVEIPPIEELGDARSTMSKIIGGIGALGYEVQEGAREITSTLANPIDSTNAALEGAKAKILQSMQAIGDTTSIILSLAIKYILNVFFLFFIMPLVYFYALWRVVRKDSPRIIFTEPKEAPIITTKEQI